MPMSICNKINLDHSCCSLRYNPELSSRLPAVHFKLILDKLHSNIYENVACLDYICSYCVFLSTREWRHLLRLNSPLLGCLLISQGLPASDRKNSHKALPLYSATPLKTNMRHAAEPESRLGSTDFTTATKEEMLRKAIL